MNPYIHQGQVVQTDDPDQMGRVKVWCPVIDGESYDIASLPWAEYASPLAGFTVAYPTGGVPTPNDSQSSYGFWSIPKKGALVFLFCLNGNEEDRFYFASSYHLHSNRSLPLGRNTDLDDTTGPFSDAGDDSGLDPVEPTFSNLREQFQDKISESESITRGYYERQVAQPRDVKDGKEGYARTQEVGTDPESEKNFDYLDSQTHCWVTPGRHALIFQDFAPNSRVRLKTSDGHQVILDDANERIYVSTAKGKSWIELDSDGHVHIFGQASVSIRAGENLNLFADQDINIEAKKAINIKADGGDIRIQTAESFHMSATKDALLAACGDFDINSDGALRLSSKKGTDLKSGTDTKISAANGIDLKAGESMKLQSGSAMGINGGAGMKLSAPKIDLNGPSAPDASPAEQAHCAQGAKDPTVVPGHEPWKRPITKAKRGTNWKA